MENPDTPPAVRIARAKVLDAWVSLARGKVDTEANPALLQDLGDVFECFLEFEAHRGRAGIVALERAAGYLGKILSSLQDETSLPSPNAMLEGLADALSIVFENCERLKQGLPLQPAPSSGRFGMWPSYPSAITKGDVGLTRIARPSPDSLEDGQAREHLENIANDYSQLIDGHGNPWTPWSRSFEIEASLANNLRSLNWIGPPAVLEASRIVWHPPNSGLLFAATLLLLSGPGEFGPELVLAGFGDLSAAEREAIVLACRFSPHPGLPEQCLRISAERPLARSGMLPLLVDRGHLDSQAITAAIESMDEAGLPVLLDALVRLGSFEACPLLESLLTRDLGGEAVEVVLLAGLFLGAPWALSSTRAQKIGTMTTGKIYGLVAVGDNRDIHLFCDIARKGGLIGRVATRALGWLGAPEAIPYLYELSRNEEVGEDATWATFEILGRRRPDALSSGRRYLRGEVWTVELAAARLADPALSPTWREVGARELSARTGLRGVGYDRTAPATLQQAVSNWWRNTVVAEARRFRTGVWLFQGGNTL